MDLFGIKKRKVNREEKIQAEKKAKREKEIQTKIRIKKTLNNMKSQSIKLDGFKKDYIDKARKALLINNQQTYNLATQGLKLCLSKQRFLDSMITNFDIALQMNEMNKIINEFIGSMNLIADELKTVTSSIDIEKAQAAYDKALMNNEGQYQALDAFLKEAECSLQAFNGTCDEISNEEIESLINNQAVDLEEGINDEIDKKIAEIRSKMKG